MLLDRISEEGEESGVIGFFLCLFSILIILAIVNFAPLLTIILDAWLWLIIGTVIAGEILFLEDEARPGKKDNLLRFTARRKSVSFTVGFGIIAGGLGIYEIGSKYIVPYLVDNGAAILTAIGWGALIICVGALLYLIGYGYVKLNSSKYTRG